jgi:hypothetical protein
MRKLLLALLIPALMPAQNTSSGLSGSIQDPTGAALAGAQVTLTNEDTGFVRTAATNDRGFFSFPDLTPGTLAVAVSVPGFKAYRQTAITLGSSEQRSLGVIRLVLGEMADTVTVTAEATAVNTVSGEKSASLTGDELGSLALRGRDLFDAVSLMPGVVDTTDGRDAPSTTSSRNIYIAGGRNESKNVTLDGVYSVDTGSADAVQTMPSMDSIAEMKLLTSNYAAEYGRNSGGTITFITKGGGKVFHGSANWYHRHEQLNANDYFGNLAGRQRSPYRYNIVGYTLSGPIPIPRVNSDRNKLFFFFSQEFQRQKVPWGTKTITMPTAAERTGDFSRSFDVNARLIPVQDPLNGKAAFPGNIIPASRISSLGRSILNMFPLPNYTDPNPSRLYQWNYFSAESGAYPRRTDTVRIDYSPRQNWQMYARVSMSADERHAPYGIWGTGSVNYKPTNIISNAPGKGATVHSTNTVTPTLFNEILIGYSYNQIAHDPEEPDLVNRTKLGINIPQRNPALNPSNLIPNMTFGGIANPVNLSMSNPMPNFLKNPLYSLVDNLSKVWDTHTFKVGIYFERTQKVQPAGVSTRGTLQFDRDTLNNLDANNAFANALLGNYDAYSEATSAPVGDYRFANTEWYVQDTWRVARRLSLDYGIRFYHDPPQYERLGQAASFSPAAYKAANAPVLLRPGYDASGKKAAIDPRTGTVYSSGLIGNFAPGAGDTANGMLIGGKNGVPLSMYTFPTVFMAPRLGFALDPFGTGRTAIRGGFGMFYDRLAGNPNMNTTGNPPIVYSPTQYYGTLAGIQEQVSSALLSPSGTAYSLASPGHVPTTYNYSLGIQRQMGRSMLAELSYVGSISRHLVWMRNVNPVPLGSNFLAIHPENRDPTTTNSVLPPNFRRPYTGYGDIYLYEFAATANYNSLQASFSQRFRRGITAGGSYTFSKALSTADSYSSSIDPFYSPRERNYGPVGYDRSHLLSARYSWTLPKLSKGIKFRPAQWVLDGWESSGVMRMSSGAPLTPSMALVSYVDYAGSASASVRPSVGDPHAALADRFVVPTVTGANVPTLGNVGKGILRGPGVNNWDLSLYKRIRLMERLSAQLRLESYNTFNHTQFSAVDSSLRFDAKGSQINQLFMQATTSRPPRRVQLALRLNW